MPADLERGGRGDMPPNEPLVELTDALIEAAIEAAYEASFDEKNTWQALIRLAVETAAPLIAARVRAEALGEFLTPRPDLRNLCHRLLINTKSDIPIEEADAQIIATPTDHFVITLEADGSLTTAPGPVVTPNRPQRYDQCDGTCTVDCGHCKGQGRPVATPTEPEWRATSSGRLLSRNPDRIERRFCGCVTGWDDAYEQCVLIHCGRHSVATPAEPEGRSGQCGVYEAAGPIRRCRLDAGHHGRCHLTDQGSASPVLAEQPLSASDHTDLLGVAISDAMAEQPEER